MKQFLLLQHCFRLLTFGTITTSDTVRRGHFLLISVGSVKISFKSSCFLLKAFDPHSFCVVPVSLQGSCACLVSTWQHLISIGHCPHSVYSRSTSVPLMVRENNFKLLGYSDSGVLCDLSTLICSACSTPSHASRIKKLFNIHGMFWTFR